MKKVNTLISLCTVIAVSYGCSSTTPATSGNTSSDGTKVSGETIKVFDSEVSTWAKLDSSKTVTEAGITLPLKVVEGSPTDKATAPTFAVASFPAEVKNTTFLNNLSLDYMPGGHAPDGVYNLPHFDIHFYNSTPDEIKAIDCKDTTLPDMAKMPANFAFLPPDKPECVPNMGYHALDVTSPELSQTKPEKFTKTLILGFYKGKMAFIEPMVTREFLLTKANFEYSIPKPTGLFDKTTLYPTNIKATFDSTSNSYSMVFSKFEKIN